MDQNREPNAPNAVAPAKIPHDLVRPGHSAPPGSAPATGEPDCTSPHPGGLGCSAEAQGGEAEGAPALDSGAGPPDKGGTPPR